MHACQGVVGQHHSQLLLVVCADHCPACQRTWGLMYAGVPAKVLKRPTRCFGTASVSHLRAQPKSHSLTLQEVQQQQQQQSMVNPPRPCAANWMLWVMTLHGGV
eukprot:GHRQ01023669.1.p3 GENE.GHRQ01023669.1~~GHRQ01023669.1.p3  ORF type:complete len:104 (-),score=22.25 GHRQ01023669.1:20-331(-)